LTGGSTQGGGGVVPEGAAGGATATGREVAGGAGCGAGERTC